MNDRLTRRGLIAAAPATGVAMVATPFAHAMPAQGSETEILRLFREWRAYFEWAEGPATDGMDAEAFDAALDGLREIEDRMFALPCQNPMDVLAKLMAFTHDGDEFADDDGRRSSVILADAKAIIDGVLA